LRYVLDTNTCVYAMKGHAGVIRHLRAHGPDDLGVTIITVAELLFGAEKSQRREANRALVETFLGPFEVLPFDRVAAEAYARIRLSVERAGSPIGERDLQIGAIAVARELTVVTHNVSEFARVPGLPVVDWA
jgi:tRNA(fMet)-specific endonuclease VapC